MGGLNLYGYGAGDPINTADPFGLCVGVQSGWNILRCALGLGWIPAVGPRRRSLLERLSVTVAGQVGMTQMSASVGGTGAVEGCVELVGSTDAASAEVGAEVELSKEPSNTVATTTVDRQVAPGPAGSAVSVTTTVATGSDRSQTVTRAGVTVGYSASKLGPASRTGSTTVLKKTCTSLRSAR